MNSKHPTITISLTNFQLDRDSIPHIDTDAHYVLVDSRIWQHVIIPLINADDESRYALRHNDYSGPHLVSII